MNSNVKRRPSIPLGTEIPNFPPISRPLHCDETLEIYLLEKSNERTLIAIFYSVPAEVAIDKVIGALESWWSVIPDELVYPETVRRYLIGQREYVCAIVSVCGEWIPECGSRLNEIEDATLRTILEGAASLSADLKKSGFVPVLESSLTWLTVSPERCLLIPLVAKPWSEDNESKSVRELSRLIYFLTTDIDTENSSGKAIELSRWVKRIKPETSRILAKCLQSTPSTDQVLCFDTLSSLLSSNSKTESLVLEHPASGGLARVAGMHKLKTLLKQDVVEPLRDPVKFKRYGLTVPNGVLLFGPPGCGKTYISKQLAEELGYFFLEVIPSEIAGSYIHQTVLKIRDLFETAAENAPSVIFIDEFEALVPSRSELGSHQQYKSEEVNELLVQLGTCSERNIFLIAATNEPAKIDNAVRRTGRLDKLIYVGPPDEEARIEMLSLHLQHRPTDNLDIAVLASTLSGYSASDIKFVVDEAARLALRQDQSPITMEILRNAIKRVPPSVTPEDESRFESFTERGTD